MTKKTPPSALVDPSILRTIFGNNNMAIHAFLEKLIISSKASLIEINLALEHHEQATVLHQLHRLKGPVGSIGFNKMYKLCERCEAFVQQEHWENAKKTSLEIEKILDKLKLELAL